MPLICFGLGLRNPPKKHFVGGISCDFFAVSRYGGGGAGKGKGDVGFRGKGGESRFSPLVRSRFSPLVRSRLSHRVIETLPLVRLISRESPPRPQKKGALQAISKFEFAFFDSMRVEVHTPLSDYFEGGGESLFSLIEGESLAKFPRSRSRFKPVRPTSCSARVRRQLQRRRNARRAAADTRSCGAAEGGRKRWVGVCVPPRARTLVHTDTRVQRACCKKKVGEIPPTHPNVHVNDYGAFASHTLVPRPLCTPPAGTRTDVAVACCVFVLRGRNLEAAVESKRSSAMCTVAHACGL